MSKIYYIAATVCSLWGCAQAPEVDGSPGPEDAIGVAEAAASLPGTTTTQLQVSGKTYCIYATTTNKSTYTTDHWDVKFVIRSPPAPVPAPTNVTNAICTLTDGYYKCSNTSSNGAISPGGTVQFSFCGTGRGASVANTNLQFCGPFYRDWDGDRFGDPNAPITSCSMDPPSNYVTNKLDTCDSDAKVHPGTIDWYSARSACGTYDYNGDGIITKQPNQLGPTNCGEPTVTCTYNPSTGQCDAVCNSACGDVCTWFEEAACGEVISVRGRGCTAYGPDGNWCKVYGWGNSTYTYQRCH
jgi:hypothetical protein